MSWLFRTAVFSGLEETDPDLPEHCTVVIVGTGAAGLGVGKRLARAGRGDFLLLERDVALDDSLRRTALTSGVWSHVRFDAPLLRACWDAPHAMWRLRASRGAMTANFLVLATGASTDTVVPHIHGRDGRGLDESTMTVAGFPNLFVVPGPDPADLELVTGGLNFFSRKRIREFEVRTHVAPRARRMTKRFNPHNYHLTVGHLYHGDPRYREVENVPVPSAVGSERLAP